MEPEQLAKICKITSIIAGILMVFPIGIFGLTSIDDVTDAVVAIYMMLFGPLTLFCEFGFKFVYRNFGFLSSFTGRGAFYIFVGTLALGISGLIGILVGLVIIFNGVFNFALGMRGQTPGEKAGEKTGSSKDKESESGPSYSGAADESPAESYDPSAMYTPSTTHSSSAV